MNTQSMIVGFKKYITEIESKLVFEISHACFHPFILTLVSFSNTDRSTPFLFTATHLKTLLVVLEDSLCP